ncbi:hypothetical protein NOVO_02520 [Rickettsiales bacterium Ac37b]|nr:hypothetical protein NOVO_02520 [Rickettsiales bacterium Ac37b]
MTILDNSCNISLNANNTTNIQVIYYNNSLYSQINQNVICKSSFTYGTEQEVDTRTISYLNNAFNYVENYICPGHVDEYNKYCSIEGNSSYSYISNVLASVSHSICPVQYDITANALHNDTYIQDVSNLDNTTCLNNSSHHIAWLEAAAIQLTNFIIIYRNFNLLETYIYKIKFSLTSQPSRTKPT